MPRIETLERHMFGHAATNTHGVHPVMFGDGSDRPGIVGEVREVKFYIKLAIAVVCVFGSAILVAIANTSWSKLTAPSQTVSQSVSTADPADSTAFYTTAQLAKMLAYSEREIQDRASKGEIPGAWRDGKAWRFDKPSIDAWIAASAATAAKDHKSG
jgi:excisionase family DNA binding protein